MNFTRFTAIVVTFVLHCFYEEKKDIVLEGNGKCSALWLSLSNVVSSAIHIWMYMNRAEQVTKIHRIHKNQINNNDMCGCEWWAHFRAYRFKCFLEIHIKYNNARANSIWFSFFACLFVCFKGEKEDVYLFKDSVWSKYKTMHGVQLYILIWL